MIVSYVLNERVVSVNIIAQQRIERTLAVLKEKGLVVVGDMQYVRNKRTNNLVNIYLSYEEANIRNGDALVCMVNNKDDIEIKT